MLFAPFSPSRMPASLEFSIKLIVYLLFAVVNKVYKDKSFELNLLTISRNYDFDDVMT
jgi:hypothetical protein